MEIFALYVKIFGGKPCLQMAAQARAAGNTAVANGLCKAVMAAPKKVQKYNLDEEVARENERRRLAKERAAKRRENGKV